MSNSIATSPPIATVLMALFLGLIEQVSTQVFLTIKSIQNNFAYYVESFQFSPGQDLEFSKFLINSLKFLAISRLYVCTCTHTYIYIWI